MERSLLTVYPNIMKNVKLSILCCLLSLRLLQNLSKVFCCFFSCSSKQSYSNPAFCRSGATAQEEHLFI